MEKSHVSMEQKKCIICTKDYESGVILLDKKLKASMERHTLTGWGICPDCQAKIDESYFPLVVIDTAKSEITTSGNIKSDSAWRTGEIIFLKKNVAEQIFTPMPKSEFTFIDIEDSEKIKAIILQEV